MPRCVTSAMGPGCVKTPALRPVRRNRRIQTHDFGLCGVRRPPTREFYGQLKVRPEFSHGLGRQRTWHPSPQSDAGGSRQSLSGVRLRENSTGRLSGQCILARYNVARLNPRGDLPAPARRRQIPLIRGLRPILSFPRAYSSNARRALVFDSLHHPADAVPGAACPTGPR